LKQFAIVEKHRGWLHGAISVGKSKKIGDLGSAHITLKDGGFQTGVSFAIDSSEITVLVMDIFKKVGAGSIRAIAFDFWGQGQTIA
jgi:hypothetical protein